MQYKLIYMKCKNRQNYNLTFKGSYVAGGTMKRSKDVYIKSNHDKSEDSGYLCRVTADLNAERKGVLLGC